MSWWVIGLSHLSLRLNSCVFAQQKGTLNFNQPFDIPIIHNILASRFFDGPKSLAVQNRSRLKSSAPHKPHELEIPEGMLILTLILVRLAF